MKRETQTPATEAACLSAAQARVVCKELFGMLHPEDVIEPIHLAADALEWLREVFISIGSEPGISRRIRVQCEMGAYLATDAAHLADDMHETMQAAIKKALEG